MRIIVIAFILLVAGIIGYFALQPACRGGAVIKDSQSCASAFDTAFCATAMRLAADVAVRSGEVFSSQSACLERWPVCIARRDVQGFAPKPSGYCVARDASGGLARLEPVYSVR
jgi:hypothetical protein